MIKDTLKYIYYIVITTLLFTLDIEYSTPCSIVKVYKTSQMHIASTNSVSDENFSTEIMDITTALDQAQCKAQIGLFKKAVDELGAPTPDEAAALWIKGDKTRNGVYKYVSMCSNLKADFIKQWGNPENNMWVIGTSSPWLQNYEIVKKAQINRTTYVFTINYYWATSSGVSKPQRNILTIVKEGTKWCVQKASLQ